MGPAPGLREPLQVILTPTQVVRAAGQEHHLEPLPAGLQVSPSTPDFHRGQKVEQSLKRKVQHKSNYRKTTTGTEKQPLDIVITVLRNLGWKKKQNLAASSPSISKQRPEQVPSEWPAGAKPGSTTRAQIPQSRSGTKRGQSEI